jgi:hypothetical protein
MNLEDPRHPWSRLVRAARRAPDEREAAAPYGFATRVGALAFSSVRSVSLVERYAFRALGIAGLLAVLSVAVNFPALLPADAAAATEEEIGDSPVELLLTVVD